MTALVNSQTSAEVIRSVTATMQASQTSAEVIRSVTATMQVSQVAVEVLRFNSQRVVTDDQFTAWLADSTVIRALLFEVGCNVSGSETTRYLSNAQYNTGAADTPANTSYQPIVSTNGLMVTESISYLGDSALTIGDIEVWNVSGERDTWLNDIWANRTVQVFLGDPRWIRADFRLVFSGTLVDIGSKDRSTLNLILSNKLQRLNVPMTDIKLGGDCTYTQSGTTVTITKAAHGRHIGSPVEVHFTSGTGVSGTFAITATPTVNTFTYTAATSLTTSGNVTLGGLNADSLIPLSFGELHNISPLLIDATILRYQSHGGQVATQFEIRDNGKPVSATKHDTLGTFELVASPAGTVTVSIQGDAPAGVYNNTISKLVQRIVTGYGTTASQFTSGDLDAANLAAFNTACPQPVGLYVTGDNVLSACNQLAASVGAQLVMTRAGLLRLVQITFPPSGTPTPIPQSAQIDRTLHVAARSTVSAAVKLGYCKNWTVQAGLQTTIPAEAKDSFATEWWSVTALDATVQAAWRLSAEPPAQQDTLLLTRTDAQAEADRRLARDKVVRTTYQFEGTAAHLELELGQAVTLYSNRFGLSGGVLGVVVSLSPNWQTQHVTVGVMT